MATLGPRVSCISSFFLVVVFCVKYDGLSKGRPCTQYLITSFKDAHRYKIVIMSGLFVCFLFCFPCVCITSYKLTVKFVNLAAAHKITICGDVIENPTCLCVQHSPPLPHECTLQSISKVSVSIITTRMNGLLTKCEVKMAGYWPSSFTACLWTETKSRSINSHKKNEANIQPSELNKLGQLACGIQRVVLSGQDGALG